MSIHKFKGGSVLYTGDDMYDMLLATGRGNYVKKCDFCAHLETDRCDDCSCIDGELCCSCHIAPPCSFCVGNGFEVIGTLINFKNYSSRLKRGFDWETFPTRKMAVFNKYAELENNGFVLSSEILTTGEVAIYLDKDKEGNNVATGEGYIEICRKVEFKIVAERMILDAVLQG